MLNRVGWGGEASLTQVHCVAWAVTGSSGVNGSRASSLYSCTTTKFVQMEYQVTAAGQLSLIKWNNRSHKFFLHSTNWIWMINPDQVNVVCVGRFLTLQLPNQILNSPYCQSYNCYNVGSENWVLDQLIIPKLIFFFFFITYLLDIVLILYGKIVLVTHGNERVKRGIGVNGKKKHYFLQCLFKVCLWLTKPLTVHLKTMWSPKEPPTPLPWW